MGARARLNVFDIGTLRRHRSLLLQSFDLAAWLSSYVVMGLLMKAAYPAVPVSIVDCVAAGVAGGVLFLLLASPFRVHQGRSPVGSFEEALLIAPIAAIVGVLVAAIDMWAHSFRAIVAFAAPWMALMLLLWVRGVYRVVRDNVLLASTPGGRSEPVVILGAGEGARQLIGALMRDPSSPWTPVALLDDDPFKRYRRLRGVPVMGGTDQLARTAARLGAGTAILAIPTAPAALVRSVSSVAAEHGLQLKILPGPYELRDRPRVNISDVRDLHVSDILGRRQIETDLATIAGYLADRRVLVTGAGGSIGSELCRQIAQFNPRELIMLDRDESALHAVELAIHGRGLLDGDNTVLGDIRDRQFVMHLFEERRPEVVFHAAALKHLPLLEKAPGEAIKTNVWGSLNVLDAAAKVHVGRFVNISTDKAANPSSVLGYSKRLAEGLTAAVAEEADGSFLSVRFGNVLGSRGSVLTAFASQISAGGPVTVTDPGVTRYFMTIQEAVELVIQAGAIGRPGEVLVLDMGEPVSIDSVARHLIGISGDDVEVVYTGLRPGEKLHEELFGDGEVDVRPEHDLISHATVPAYDRIDALELDPALESQRIRSALALACEGLADRVRQET